jgi:hypothetical protein
MLTALLAINIVAKSRLGADNKTSVFIPFCSGYSFKRLISVADNPNSATSDPEISAELISKKISPVMLRINSRLPKEVDF